MKKKFAKCWLALPLTAFALSACVTINIYFPAAAAGKAADQIIAEIWQLPKKANTPLDQPDTPEVKTKKPVTKDIK